MSVKSRADLNSTLNAALITGGRQSSAANVKAALIDILDSLAVYGDMHVVNGAAAQNLTDSYAALTGLTTVGQSLGLTLTPASGQVAMAVAGTYAVSVRLRCAGVAATTYTTRLLVNGAPVSYLLDEYLTTGTESFLLLLNGFIQTSAAAQTVVLQAKSSNAAGAVLTIVQGSLVVKRVQ